MIHSLFGGISTSQQSHSRYLIRVEKGSHDRTCNALDQQIICSNIEPVCCDPGIKELREFGVELKEVDDGQTIELLIGADVAGKLYTDKRYILKSGIVEMVTLLEGKITISIT